MALPTLMTWKKPRYAPSEKKSEPAKYAYSTRPRRIHSSPSAHIETTAPHRKSSEPSTNEIAIQNATVLRNRYSEVWRSGSCASDGGEEGGRIRGRK